MHKGAALGVEGGLFFYEGILQELSRRCRNGHSSAARWNKLFTIIETKIRILILTTLLVGVAAISINKVPSRRLSHQQTRGQDLIPMAQPPFCSESA